MQSDSLQLIETYTTIPVSKLPIEDWTTVHRLKTLDQWLLSPFSESYSLLIVGSEVSPLQLRAWIQKNRAQIKKSLKIIYIYDFLSRSEIVILSEISEIYKILSLQEPSEAWKQLWQDVVGSFSHILASADILGKVRSQNKVLQELNENLEKIVEQRTHHLEVSKKEIENKNKEIRELIKFIKSLSNIEAFEDLILILKHEFIRYHKVESPLLIYSLHAHTYRCISFQGPQILDRVINADAVQATVHDPQKLRETLAETLKRPMGPLLCVAVERSEHKGYFIFEHSMDLLEQKNFLRILDTRMESLRVAFDRLALKWKAHQISRQWSSTFDAVKDPIVIVDKNYRVIRSNKSFSESSAMHCYQRFAGRDQVCVGCPVATAFGQKKSQTGKVNGSGNRLFEVHAYPIEMEPSEQSLHTIVHYADMTQAIKLQGQIIQSEKMSALGLLAGNIAHELNNPLTGIKSLSQILLTEIGPQHVATPDLREIEHAAERSENIIKNLLDFSSLHESEKEKVSLRSVVEKTLPFLKTTMRYHRSHIELQEGDDRVEVEPQLLQQVIFNLVNNACQAMGETGTLTLRSQIQTNEIYFSVHDTGPGVPPSIREAIFTPFFTTKEEGQGTGLGLSMSRSIIEKFDGKLYLNEEKREGTEFVIVLPKVGKK